MSWLSKNTHKNRALGAGCGCGLGSEVASHPEQREDQGNTARLSTQLKASTPPQRHITDRAKIAARMPSYLALVSLGYHG
jgi:hypothetical protein